MLCKRAAEVYEKSLLSSHRYGFVSEIIFQLYRAAQTQGSSRILRHFTNVATLYRKKNQQTQNEHEIRAQPAVIVYQNMYSFITHKMSTNKYLVENQVRAVLTWSSHHA